MMEWTYKYVEVSVEWGNAATSIEGLLNDHSAAGWQLHTMNVTMMQNSGERLFSMVFQRPKQPELKPMYR